MRNFWIEMAQEIGVEFEEEFNYTLDGYCCNAKITENGLFVKVCNIFSVPSLEFVSKIIAGEGKIKLLPFRPQIGEDYYTYTSKGEVFASFWGGRSIDYVRFIAGLVFRTRDEAINYLPTWEERISNL